MVMHPIGPLAASTYWRRRVVLLIGVLLLLVLAKSCAGGDSPTKSTATPTPTASTPTGSTPTPTPSPTVKPVRTPAAGSCADGALTLTTTTDADAYAVGGTPKITLVVKNTSAAACRRDLGAGAVELLVFSGQDRVWSSDDCNPGKAVAVATLAPAGSQSVVKTWTGTRSKPGCAGTKAQARPGTYRVMARVGTLRVEGAVFRIQA